MQLDESGLEHLISSLTDGPYSQTARLVEDLELGYELGVYQGVETESKDAPQGNEQNPSPEDPIAVAASIPDESRPPGPSFKLKKRERLSPLGAFRPRRSISCLAASTTGDLDRTTKATTDRRCWKILPIP